MTTVKTYDPLAYLSLCVGNGISENTRRNLLREAAQVFFPHRGVILDTDSVFRPLLPATVSCSAALLSSLG